MSERARDLPIFIPERTPSGYSAWQLEGSVGDGGPWEIVNAGPSEADIRGRFFADQNYYRLVYLHPTGTVSITPHRAVPGRAVPAQGNRLNLVV